MEGKTILLRFERDKNSEKGFELSLKLYEALKGNSRVNLPNPLFFMPEYNLQAFEWVEAEKFSELLRGSDPELWVKRAALVLSELHSCKVLGLPEHKASLHKDRIQHTADLLAHANQDIKNISEEIARRLNSIPVGEAGFAAGFVHGDFHQGQLLVADRRSYVLDLSRSYLGDSTADVGNFLAQLKYWHIIGRLKNIGALEQLFIGSYKSSGNVKVPEQRLKYWKTIGLFELAMREFRRMKPDWPIMCEKLLLECQNTLDA
jgi:aminoglycoside phosphotransferase (APT) family kinase protein